MYVFNKTNRCFAFSKKNMYTLDSAKCATLIKIDEKYEKMSLKLITKWYGWNR